MNISVIHVALKRLEDNASVGDRLIQPADFSPD
jgi:hypothetical protein